MYVATNGYAFGVGAIDRPFNTPQAGYDYAAATYSNQPATLVIAAGTYSGGLNMHAGNVHVLGHGRPQLGSLIITAPANSILGKQRVENIVVAGVTTVAADMGKDVKFHNCRFDDGLLIYNSNVEVQDCYARGADGPAITVGNGSSTIRDIAIYNSSIFNQDSANAALLVNPLVRFFEVIGCEIANFDPGSGAPAWAAIEDRESALDPTEPPHLYSHNVIRGSPPGLLAIPPAVYDHLATNGSPTITFVQNSVWGNVGVTSNLQYYANNLVYGQINNTGGPLGWSQAGFGSPIDAAGNTEHFIVYPQSAADRGTARGFPAAWKD